MHFVIAGGAGFVGSHLVKRLLAASEQNFVTVLDDYSTGSKENLPDLRVTERLRIIDVNVGDSFFFDRFHVNNRFGRVDIIYNLACPASPIAYQRIPIHTLNTCFNGTKNLLVLAKEHHARFLQASTSEVYGDPSVHPQPESYWGNVNSYGPRSCYDEGKRVAEALVYEYRDLVDTRIVRIFNTYGPNMAKNDGRVVSNFIVQALNGNDITIYGDGSQTRSFQYVDDLIDGLLVVMRSSYTSPINLGNPGEFTMLELAQKVLTLVGGCSTIVHLDLPVNDPKQRKPVIELAKHLGWEPKISLDDGLKKTIDYFKGK